MRRIAALMLLALAAPCAAQVQPQPGQGDPRIQSVDYDPEQVVTLQIAAGYQLTVEFAPDERIESIAVGDSGAWLVTPNKRGDHLFIKAAQSGVTTNLTVVTDARSYLFELVPGYGGMTAYAVRFRYPAAALAQLAEIAPAEAGRYRLSGAKSLRPSAIDDDGAKTFIVWPEGKPLPAVFAAGAGGEETVVNGGMRDGRYVLDTVTDRLVFRLGKQVAGAVRVPQRGQR